VSFPLALVRHGRDDVPVLLGLDGDGNLAGLDPVEGRFLALDPGDVGAIFDTDPAAVYFGVQLAWARGVELPMAADRDDLERYRRHAVDVLKDNGGFLLQSAADVLRLPVREVYIVGSVLDPKSFTESSDIDAAFVVDAPGLAPGLNEQLSSKLQEAMSREPFGDLGVINTLVFVGALRVKKGKSLKIADATTRTTAAEPAANPYHGSWSCLPVGTILLPMHRHSISETERILEAAKPKGVLSRNDAVWITRNVQGVYHAGGGESYVYKVEPIGPKYGPFDGGWVGQMNWTEDEGGSLKKMADAYWRGAPCKGKNCYGAHEYLVGSARIVEIVSHKDADAKTCSGSHQEYLPAGGIVAEGLPSPRRAELGRKFSPMLTRDPFSVPVTGFDEVRAQLLKHRAEVPSVETIRLTTIFAGLTVGVGIAQAEHGFQCLVDLFKHAHGSEPPIGKVRDCIWSLGYHQIRERLYSEVPGWAPVVQEALKRGLRDRELRAYLFLHTETPAGISLAKLSFTLALLGQNLVCLDVRILDRMFGAHMASKYSGTWDTATQLSLARYERVEDAFLRFNSFYRPDDPIGRARAQWLSWESAGRPARVETHAVWLNVMRTPGGA
jgi:hypothetical protein